MDRDGALTGEQLDRLILHQIRPVVRVVPVDVDAEVDLVERLLTGLPIAAGDLSQLLPPPGVQLRHAAH